MGFGVGRVSAVFSWVRVTTTWTLFCLEICFMFRIHALFAVCTQFWDVSWHFLFFFIFCQCHGHVALALSWPITSKQGVTKSAQWNPLTPDLSLLYLLSALSCPASFLPVSPVQFTFQSGQNPGKVSESINVCKLAISALHLVIRMTVKDMKLKELSY